MVSANTVHEGHLCKFHSLVHSPSEDRRWAIREVARSIDCIWVLSNTHSVQLSVDDPKQPKALTFDDWGQWWRGLENPTSVATKNSRLLTPSSFSLNGTEKQFASTEECMLKPRLQPPTKSSPGCVQVAKCSPQHHLLQQPIHVRLVDGPQSIREAWRSGFMRFTAGIAGVVMTVVAT